MDTPPDTDALLRQALRGGMSPRDAAREVARATGQARREVYARVLALQTADAPRNAPGPEGGLP
jgi:hypothetical protein